MKAPLEFQTMYQPDFVIKTLHRLTHPTIWDVTLILFTGEVFIVKQTMN